MSEPPRERSWADRAATRRTLLGGAAGIGAVALGAGTSLLSSPNPDAGRGIPTPRLHVDGNLLKDPAGNEVTLRGVCTADPKRISAVAAGRGKTAPEVIDLATDEERGWYSRVIKLPVQPGDIGKGTAKPGEAEPVAFSRDELETYIEDHLDPAVNRCERVGAYCIIDYHRHKMFPFMSSAIDEELRLFWDAVASRYSERSHVLFELYNEPVKPTEEDIQLERKPDHMREIWSKWKTAAQPWVNLIREHAPETPILIGSPHWSTYPQGALHEEFDGENLLYTLTIYPAHEPETPAQCDEWIDSVWEQVPLFVTEWGYKPETDNEHIRGTSEAFGSMMRTWFSNRPIHWTAWCFDPFWAPGMFELSDGEWQLLGEPYQGAFIKRFLADFKDRDIPTPQN